MGEGEDRVQRHDDELMTRSAAPSPVVARDERNGTRKAGRRQSGL
jgi:hypothetical protein